MCTYGEGEGVVCMDVLTSSVSLPEPSIRRKPLTYLDVSDQCALVCHAVKVTRA